MNGSEILLATDCVVSYAIKSVSKKCENLLNSCEEHNVKCKGDKGKGHHGEYQG